MVQVCFQNRFYTANNNGLSYWAEFKPDLHFCRVRAVPEQSDGGNLNKVEQSKNVTGSLINMGKPGKVGQQKGELVKKERQSSKSETDHERSKAIKPEPQLKVGISWEKNERTTRAAAEKASERPHPDQSSSPEGEGTEAKGKNNTKGTLRPT